MHRSEILSVLAVDTGAKRTGLATWTGQTRTMSEKPWDAVQWLQQMLDIGYFDVVVLERWVPYPGAQHGNAWRELTEVLTLGAMEWECRKSNTHFVYQQTSILTPTMAYADAHDYEWVATNRDEKAAETHLYHYLNMQDQPTKGRA